MKEKGFKLLESFDKAWTHSEKILLPLVEHLFSSDQTRNLNRPAHWLHVKKKKKKISVLQLNPLLPLLKDYL